MLVVETIARIRREHFIKGKTIKEIVRDLKVSRNTVRKVLRSGETSFEYERQVQPRPKLVDSRRFDGGRHPKSFVRARCLGDH
ncbi:putative transcriptional regulator [Bradyrhizobium japonicum]|nr:putative transcriptional regulator [Bradyrhizobium elkanii]MCS3568736.1 putative transcriptional regulator [Bradyrhizobium elkanii]MCS3589780.1 putative transcriptional regulator [Bradyrhizobium elkanii]MCS3619222.1 putative transcriptional regulator [Bradyrhizobium elkanii]MCS3693961.1 putative transcriptional regulator [Bradyrhizobium elkanii]